MLHFWESTSLFYIVPYLGIMFNKTLLSINAYFLLRIVFVDSSFITFALLTLMESQYILQVMFLLIWSWDFCWLPPHFYLYSLSLCRACPLLFVFYIYFCHITMFLHSSFYLALVFVWRNNKNWYLWHIILKILNQWTIHLTSLPAN